MGTSHKLFIDTGALLSYYNDRDQYYPKSLEAWRTVQEQNCHLIITNHVIDELATHLARINGYLYSASKVEKIYEAGFQIIYANKKIEQEALKLFKKFSDQKFTFTDCVSMVVMKQEGLETAFTFDSDFYVGGFQIFPTRKMTQETLLGIDRKTLFKKMPNIPS